MLVSHTIDGINHGGEVLTPFKTCLLILILFLKCCALQNFFRSAIPVTLGIRIADLNVKNSGPPSLPKAVRSNISMGFVAQHLTLSPLCRCQFPPIKDFWFGGDSRGRQGHQAQVCQFFAYVAMPLSYKAALLTADPVLHCKGFVASITAVCVCVCVCGFLLVKFSMQMGVAQLGIDLDSAQLPCRICNG